MTVVGALRVARHLHRGPMTVQRIATVGNVGLSTAQEWVAKWHEAGEIERAGLESAPPGRRGLKAVKWQLRDRS